MPSPRLYINPVFLLLLLCAAASAPAAGPTPPCGQGPAPDYPPADQPPNIRVWYEGDLQEPWQPPECTGWSPRGFTVLVALAGTFEFRGTTAQLLERIGAISQFDQIQYWSVTRQRWREFIKEAYALIGPDEDLKRADFSAEEMRSGRTLYFWQDENTPAGEIIYKMRARNVDDRRMVINVENVYTQRYFLLTLFRPGEYQFAYFIERGADDTWHYYGMMRAGSGPRLLARGHKSSYINRAAAVYRYVAGIPTDKEPPAAPKEFD